MSIHLSNVLKNITLKDVSLSYGKRELFHILDFSITSWEKILLQWPSWSGKTSILQLLSGLQFPTSWSIIYSFDQSTINTDSHNFSDLRRDVLAMTFAEPLFFDTLSVRENIYFPHLFLKKTYRKEWAARLISLLKIEQHLDTSIRLLSSGEKDRVNIIRALLYDDPIILLDEPGAHMDSALFQDFFSLLEEYIAQIKPTLIIVSHSDIFMKIVDRTYICEKGDLLPKK